MNWYKTAQEEITLNMVRDPNCPPEILTKALLTDVSILIAMSAAKNPNTPPEVLAKALERVEVSLVSRNVVKNPNTPLEAKVDWLEKVLINESAELNLENSSFFRKIFEELKDESFLLSVLWGKDHNK